MDDVVNNHLNSVKTTKSDLSIRNATANDIPPLEDVERSAASLYKSTAFTAVTEGTLGEASLMRMLQTNTIWIACDGDKVTGFAACFPNGQTLHLQELSVCAWLQRQGIGRMLLRHVVESARDRGFSRVSLCTFRDLPWCKPFYETVGFRVVGETEMCPELRGVWKRDGDDFPDRSTRVAMLLAL